MANGDDENMNRSDYERMKKEAQDFLSVSKEIESNQRSLLGTIAELHKQQQELNRLQKQYSHLIDEEGNIRQNLTQEERQKAEEVKKSFKAQKDHVNQLKDAIDNTKLLRKATEGVGQAIDSVGKSLKEGVVNELKSTPRHLLETTKEIKSAELRMGMLSKQSGEFTNKLTDAAQQATQMGASVGDLAEFQANYNAQIGRSVSLTEQGLESMTALAEGTQMGKEGAAEFAGQMDLFGKSLKSTEDLLNNTLETSEEMGTSFEKTVENLREGSKLAQRFHFEEGMEDVSKMASRAAKFRMEMESVAPMAEKVFNVEGAVETAAQLQVMGGEVAKMADPFKMMFEARHDFDAFHESVVEATKGMATFNEETGEVEIEGLQLHRLREVAERTGIQFEELAKSARQAKKFSMIEGELNMNWGDFKNPEEAKELFKGISSLNEQGKAVVEIDGNERLVSKLKNPEKVVQEEINRQKTLKEMAKQSKTFDDAWRNMMEAVKSTILPGFKSFTDSFTDSIQGIQDYWDKNNINETLKGWGESAGNLASSLIKFITDNPLKSLILGGAAAFIGKQAQWIMRGRWLGTGFLSKARSMGMMGGGVRGATTSTSAGRGGAYAQTGAGLNQQSQTGGRSGIMGRIGRGAKAFGKSAARGGATGLALSGGINALQYAQGNMEGSEAIGRTLITGGLTAAGTALGSLAGGVGAPIGGTAGAMGAQYINNAIWGEQMGKKGASAGQQGGDRRTISDAIEARRNERMNDFVMRPGEGAVPFNENDTLVGMKEDGPMQRSMEEDKNVSMSFESPLEVRGSITLESTGGDNLSSIDLDQHPQLVREIATKVQEQLSKNIDGGKLNPNPSLT